MKKDKELLDLVLDAHGGMDAWNKLSEVSAHVQIGGVTWGFKGQQGVLDNVYFKALLHSQFASYAPFTAADLKSIFKADQVAIESLDGQIVEQLFDPRNSFAGHTRETQWTKLQLIYFASYAMWTYLTMPFNFTLPGFQTTEIEPWNEAGETWRRLEVKFPDYIQTHSEKQIFYYDKDGLLRRHDYWAVVLGGLPAAHYCSDYKEFSGIYLPTKRRVYSLNPDNSYKAEPVFVAIDLLDAEFK